MPSDVIKTWLAWMKRVFILPIRAAYTARIDPLCGLATRSNLSPASINQRHIDDNDSKID